MYLGTQEVGSRPYAEDTQRVIDEEVAALLRRADARATELLGAHREALDRLVEDLMVHETVDGDAVKAAISGEGRPTAPADSGGRMPQVQYQSRQAPAPRGPVAPSGTAG
jgi:cell division protease FtsH